MSNIKEFLKVWNDKKQIKEMSKGERCNYVYNELDNIVQFYLFKRFKEKEVLEKLYDVFEMPKFIKTMAKIVKDAKDDYAPDTAICLVITDFINARSKNLEEDEVAKYTKIVSTLLAPQIKKLTKSTCLDEGAALAIVTALPSRSIIKNEKYVGRYVQNLERILYALANKFEDDEYVGIPTEEFNTKTLKTIIKVLFEKEYKNAILMSIALDRKSIITNFSNKQISLWNVFNDYLLRELEAMDKEELKKFFMTYIEERAKDAKENKDAARRFNFQQLQDEDCKSIKKTVGKIIEKDKTGKAKKYL